MPIFELTQQSLIAVPRTSLQQQAVRERDDLQRLLKQKIEVLGENLLVIAEEFSQWEESKRRVDLVAIDTDGMIVVIELKRTEDGGHMELQAIRYAAMLSTLTFERAVEAHSELVDGEIADSRALILAFLKTSEPPPHFGRSVRIVLVAPDFSKELTTAVLWLNTVGLEIRCIRLRPYVLDGRTLLDVEQIIPLREAQEYTVRLREKQDEVRQATESRADFTRYDLTVNGKLIPKLPKRKLMWNVIRAAVDAGLTLEELVSIIPPRKLLIVDGHLRGEAFLAAAEAARTSSDYVYRPSRFFTDDQQLIDIGAKTIAVSNQWSFRSLPPIDEIIRRVPAAKMSYKESSE